MSNTASGINTAAEAEVAACQKELEDLAIQTGLDIAGIVDPTPVSDIASAGYSIKRGDYEGAALSMLGVIPYLGDLIGKSAKAAQLAKRMEKVRERMDAAIKELRLSDHIFQKAKTVGSQRQSVADLWTKQGMRRRQVGELTVEHVAKSLKRELPLLKNPRQLAKHHGPVSFDKLAGELESKGFHRVKNGIAAKQGTPENSDVFLRRIVDSSDGKEYIEAVRFDRRIADPTAHRKALGPNKTPGDLQAADKSARQQHMAVLSSEMPSTKQMAEEMNQGKFFKGDFSHWHHERFEATEVNLKQYLTPPVINPASGKAEFTAVPGLTRYDSGGFVVAPK